MRGQLAFAIERERRERLAWQAGEARRRAEAEALVLAHAEADGGGGGGGGGEAGPDSNPDSTREAERSSGGLESLVQKVEAHAQEVAFASHARNAQATQQVATEARVDTVIHHHAQHVDTMERHMHRMEKSIEVLQEDLSVCRRRGTCSVCSTNNGVTPRVGLP